MTDAPDMEPAELAKIISIIARTMAVAAGKNADKAEAEYATWARTAIDACRPYLAARSAPEAGKAVTELRGALYEAKTLLADLRIGKSIHNDRFPDNKIDGPLWNQIGKVVQRCETALASVVPSGVEQSYELAKVNAALAEAGIVLNPVADGRGAWHYEASAPQAVPAEDVAGAFLKLCET